MMIPEINDEEFDPFFKNGFRSLSSGVDIALFVRSIVVLLVVSTARTAVVVPLPPLLSSPSELIDRFLSFAAPAPPHRASLWNRTDVPIGIRSADPSE
jgi:hypothetical protein